jgi:DNA-binding PadR family transcriptional regulator
VNPPPSEVPYGTLDLMVLKTLQVMGPLHGYGIARRIEQMAEGGLALNQGTIYPALLRLEQKGWIASEWAPARPIGARGSIRLRAQVGSSCRLRLIHGHAPSRW